MSLWRFCAIVLGATATLALAGPLTPPAGAPAPTNKTLQEVEPRIPLGGFGSVVISSPGSYYLTENLEPGVASVAVTINAAGPVDLDLNGFAIQGGSSAGVRIDAPFLDVVTVIRNGTIRGFAGAGVESTTNAPVVIDNVHIQQCLNGVDLTGPALITNCTARFCNQTGFRTAEITTIRNCLSQNNADGYILAEGSVTQCVARDNLLFGFITNEPAEVSNCFAQLNGRSGFLINQRSLVTGCVANQNGEDGFNVGAKSRITNCHASANSPGGAFAGIRGDVNCTIDSCTVTDNRTGIIAGTDSLVIRNTATGNIAAAYDMTGSHHGPIVTPAGAIASTSPWANFEY